MLTLSQGQRLPLASLVETGEFQIAFEIHSGLCVDLACFGLDAAGKLSDDRYMVFFNQPQSPCKGLRLVDPSTYSLALGSLPASIDRLVFTAAIDGAGTLGQLEPSRFSLREAGQCRAVCAFSGATFQAERAVMLVEFYRKDGAWRLNAVLQGFNEGLDALVRHFGGEVAEDAPAPAAPPKVSLEKKIGAVAPQLVSLAKKAQVSLEKHRLTEVRARVGLVLDASGSMNGQYAQGRVQELVNRIVPLAVHFDSDGQLDCWAFGARPQQLSPIGLGNFADFIETDNGGWRDWEVGPRINEETLVMKSVIDFYERARDATPVYVLFVSDGGVGRAREICALMKRASALPIFWQFVGIGGRNYGVLEKMDDMTGRVVDNCDFFALDDLHELSEEALYDRLMSEFPGWLQAARHAGIVA